MTPILKKNDIVTIFQDSQNNIGYLGMGKLLKFIEKGLPFCLDEEGKELYNTEKWEIEWLLYKGNGYPRKFQKIRVQETSMSTKEYSEKQSSLPDNFIKFNDEECI